MVIFWDSLALTLHHKKNVRAGSLEKCSVPELRDKLGCSIIN